MPTLKPMVWIVIGLILAALEMIVPGLVIIWFGLAAVVTGVLAIFVHNPNFQYVTFLLFSGLGVFLAQWIGRKITQPEPEPVGALRLSGATGVVVEKIEPAKMGKVKVQGEEWRAEAKEVISPGERVRILMVDGTHLVVEVLKKEE
ncbi:MAG: NfeD family protein [bacterium]